MKINSRVSILCIMRLRRCSLLRFSAGGDGVTDGHGVPREGVRNIIFYSYQTANIDGCTELNLNVPQTPLVF